MQLILASSSIYRQSLLQKLGLPFTSMRPDIDESPVIGESVQQLTQRLARQKANLVARTEQDAWVIGSDQACYCKGQILGKPGTLENAREQLQLCNGDKAEFHTSIALINHRLDMCLQSHDIFSVSFRTLSLQEIDYYLNTDKPFDCAGSFKAESLGIALFEHMEGKDFHSLLGLPLISLCDLLIQAGINPLSAASQSLY